MTNPYEPPIDEPREPRQPNWLLIVLIVVGGVFLAAPYLMLPWWVAFGSALVIAAAVLRMNRSKPG